MAVLATDSRSNRLETGVFFQETTHFIRVRLKHGTMVVLKLNILRNGEMTDFDYLPSVMVSFERSMNIFAILGFTWL